MSFVVNAPESSFQLSLANAAVPQPAATSSPIDLFYAQRTLSLQLGTQAQLGVDELRPLALVPLFSAAEMYFRRFLARAIDVCPICAEVAGTQQVALGSFSSLDPSERAFAIAEHQGFTSEGEIARRTTKVLGIDVGRHGSLKAAISEFETLCHLRHAVVHCGGELMYLNRRNLGVSATGRLTVSLGVSEFQGVVLKVSNVVRAFNATVGVEIVKRLFRQGYLSGTWGSDRRKFAKVVDLLWSNVDMQASPDLRLLYLAAKAAV